MVWPEGWEGGQKNRVFLSFPPSISFFLLRLEVFSWNCGNDSRVWRGPRGGHGEGKGSMERGVQEREERAVQILHTPTQMWNTHETRAKQHHRTKEEDTQQMLEHIWPVWPRTASTTGGSGSRSIAASSGRHLLLEISRCTATVKLPTCSWRQLWAPQFCSMVTGELQCLLRS